MTFRALAGITEAVQHSRADAPAAGLVAGKRGHPQALAAIARAGPEPTTMTWKVVMIAAAVQAGKN